MIPESDKRMKKPRAWKQVKQKNTKANERIELFIGQRGARNEATQLFETTNPKAPHVA